jgi:GR25 family glycosyltransferase involved in LPS biosynthesis
MILAFFLFAMISSHFQKIEHGPQVHQIKNIDFIYLINLDQRPEKLARATLEFSNHGLEFFRFPAIYGWGLPRSTFDDLGVLFLPGMRFRQPNRDIAYNGRILLDPTSVPNPDLAGEYPVLGPEFHFKRCFSVSMKGGAVGCTLSHLSILQDAFDRNYNVIWIVEDDLKIGEDPYRLGDWIDRLNEQVSPSGWDILYTDCATYFRGWGDLEWIWRPDLEIDYNQLLSTKDLGQFLKIGGRGHTHSLIINRSGIEKILQFYKAQGMFLPYDMELSIIPGIRLYNLKHNVVTQNHTISDTVRKNFE